MRRLASVKAELLAEIRDSGSIVDWPTTVRGRTLDELFGATDELRESANQGQKQKGRAKADREAAKEEKERLASSEKINDSPKTWLAEAEKTAKAGGTQNYKAAAGILADLGEAVGADKGRKRACDRDKKLAKADPTLNMLKSSLRKQGLLD